MGGHIFDSWSERSNEDIFGETVSELYAGPPADFIAARNRAVTFARRSGRPELTVALKELRRPALSAWLVNRLARVQPEALDDLLALGDELRVATAAGDGDALRRLSGRRHRAVAELTAAAEQLAPRPIGDPVRREIAATLEAGVADVDGADAVRSGSLVRALQSSGFEPVDVGRAVAGTIKPRPRLRPVTDIGSRPGLGGPDPHRLAVDAARADAALAERALVKADSALLAANSRAEAAQANLVAARAMLAGAQAAVARAEAEVDRLDRSQVTVQLRADQARDKRDQARRTVAQAEARLDGRRP